MELPTSIEHCHRMIRELVEENAVLRKSGNDFGHLAERLNLALQEQRRFASELNGPRNTTRPSMRKARPLLSEDGSGRWSAAGAGLQTYAAASTPIEGRQSRTLLEPPPTRPFKWVI
jgi:hypothetical protein